MNEKQRTTVARAAAHGIRHNRRNIPSWTLVLLVAFGSLVLWGEALILVLGA